MSMFSQSCQIISRTAATTDIYGSDVQVAGGTVTVACEIQQVRRSEPGDQGEFSVTEWMGFFPTGTTFDTGDAVSEPSLGTFEVIGRPWDANSGSSAVNHVEATLKETA